MKKLLLACLLLPMGAMAQSTFRERDSLAKTQTFKNDVSWAVRVTANTFVAAGDTTSKGWFADWAITETVNDTWLIPFCTYAAQQSGSTWTMSNATIQGYVNTAYPFIAAILSRRVRGK